jgi:uncharacterized protein YpuA (DUF1002 family)
MKDQTEIYKKVIFRLNKEIEDILDNINDLMKSNNLPDEDIIKLTHYFLMLSNLNNAKTLVSTIKPTKKTK